VVAVCEPARPGPLLADTDEPGPAGQPLPVPVPGPSAPQFYIDWERQAQDTVALLRTEAGRNPHDKALSGLIGELSTRSEIFRTRWAVHNVRFHRTGLLTSWAATLDQAETAQTAGEA
jgi:MmyB-like transcription regulator ligand binding domain